MGRKPIGLKPLTAAERDRRREQKKRDRLIYDNIVPFLRSQGVRFTVPIPGQLQNGVRLTSASIIAGEVTRINLEDQTGHRLHNMDAEIRQFLADQELLAGLPGATCYIGPQAPSTDPLAGVVRQLERAKPSPDLLPEVSRSDPWRAWYPRRWFPGNHIIHLLRKYFPGIQLHPSRLSVSRALKHERASIRAQLATETSAGVWRKGEESGWWEDTSTEPIAERNHPKPPGFWNVGWNGAAQRLVWKDCKWEPYNDDYRPAHVVDTWKPKPVPKIPLAVLHDALERRVARKRYFDGVKGRSIAFHDDLDRLAMSAATEAGFPALHWQAVPVIVPPAEPEMQPALRRESADDYCTRIDAQIAEMRDRRDA